MSQRLICEQVVDRLTDLEEGSLSMTESLRMKMHLLYCLDCRELRDEVRKMPELVQQVTDAEMDALLPLAQNTLKAALARVAEFRPIRRPMESPVPKDLQQLLQAGADLTLRLMNSVHQAFVEGALPLQAPFLPAQVLAQLPSPETWTWKNKGGARVATLMDAGNNGPRLSLLVAPRGFQTPRHTHFGTEQMLVLDGLLEDGESAYASGRWVHFGEGSTHAPAVLNDECWCLIREEGTVRYTGPLGWLRNLLAA